MPPKKDCRHAGLQLEPLQFAELAGFERQDARSRVAATLESDRPPGLKNARKVEAAAQVLSATFPAPLVLPHDALNYGPDELGQSLRSWLDEEERNIPSQSRKTLYVAALPEVDNKVSFMHDWTKPNTKRDTSTRELEAPPLGNEEGQSPAVQQVDVEEVLDYLKAFYHGFTIKRLPQRLRFTAWGSDAKSRSGVKKDNISSYVALQCGKQATRIRARACPDGAFPAQVNLDDILDAALAMLPKDAYSLLLLTEHDLYEDEDDDFCCGRAYGGSRVCVVQAARYNPLLDLRYKIDQTHAWPMSHCKDYIDTICATEEVVPVKPSAALLQRSQSGALRVAIDSAARIKPSNSPEQMQALWCARVARTASHELGHCLGLDHCSYYACNMQGTAGMAEDVRQPPYLCPVCEIKVTHAVACELEGGDEARRKNVATERHLAILRFCTDRRRSEVVMWRALGAWTDEGLPDDALL